MSFVGNRKKFVFILFDRERIIFVYHDHCIFHSTIERCPRICSYVSLLYRPLYLPKNGVALLGFLYLDRYLRVYYKGSIKYSKG